MFWIITLFVLAWLVLMVGGVMWMFIRDEQDDVRQGEDI
jgi:hypothetical protein